MVKRTLVTVVGLVVAAGIATAAAVTYVGQRADPGAQGPDATALFPAPTLGEDGLFVESWYRPTTGDLSQDAALAASEGKTLAIFWELKGCEFCARLHNEALRIPALHEYVSERFYVVRLDFGGDTPIRDLDGVSASQKEIGGRHRARGTPTLEFRADDGTVALRIAGYAEPPVLLSAFEFVDTGAYREMDINAWLDAHGVY